MSILYIIVLFKGTVSHFLVEDILSTHKYTLKVYNYVFLQIDTLWK